MPNEVTCCALPARGERSGAWLTRLQRPQPSAFISCPEPMTEVADAVGKRCAYVGGDKWPELDVSPAFGLASLWRRPVDNRRTRSVALGPAAMGFIGVG
jgi:hypothetical protein